MNTATRVLVAFVAPLLVAGAAVDVTAVSASAAPGSVEATPASVCASVGGDYADYEGGGWDCYYPAIDTVSEDSLATLCGTTPELLRLPDNAVVGSASTTFYCPPVLIN